MKTTINTNTNTILDSNSTSDGLKNPNPPMMASTLKTTPKPILKASSSPEGPSTPRLTALCIPEDTAQLLSNIAALEFLACGMTAAEVEELEELQIMASVASTLKLAKPAVAEKVMNAWESKHF